MALAPIDPAPTTDTWGRISGLRPRLRSHLQWHRHYYRDRPWWILQDPASGNHYYLTEDAYLLTNMLDGSKTLEQTCSILGEKVDAPMTDELVALIVRLQAADLLQFEEPVDSASLFRRWQQSRSKMRRSAWLRPLAIRLPLVDPSPLLDALLPVVRPLFGRLPFFIWLIVVILGVLFGLQYQTELMAHGASRFLDPLNLLLLWLAYPLLKGLHELGHAFAIRIWGGSVRELGIMLLVFVPVPYVDGSAATGFPNKHRRMVVDAAGIMVESLLASLALLLWLMLQPGLLRDLAFDVMVIGSISTLLFNGNPLLRFDGYFVLADAIEIPNLARRAQQYYGYLVKRYLLGVDDVPSPVVARGERPWFLIYGAASTGYRLFISLAIALYVAGKFFFIGIVLACYLLVSQLILPLLRLLRYLAADPELSDHRSRALVIGLGTVLVLSVLLLIVPMPSNTLAEGVLRTPEKAIIRAAGSGEVLEVLKNSGEPVLTGEILMRLRDADLETQQRVLNARIHELRARVERARLADRVQAGILRDQLDELADERQEVQHKLNNLIVISPDNGILDLHLASDLPGRFVTQGDVLGLVRTDGVSTARLVVPQEQAERVRDHTLAIHAWIAGARTKRLPATALNAVPAATRHLPSASLGSLGGGRIATDVRDENGLTTIEPVFHFDLELPTGGDRLLPGTRLKVRFQHPMEPLGPRWYRSLRQLLLARFDV